jgi:hypothetical protein
VESQGKGGGEELASARAFIAAFAELFKEENFGESSIHQTINLPNTFFKIKPFTNLPATKDERYCCPRLFQRSP